MCEANLRSCSISAGLAFMLECNEGGETQNVSVSWSLVPNKSLEGVRGINVQGNTLWFLPADLSHSASYVCSIREGNQTWNSTFIISVENNTCPRANRKDELKSTKDITCWLPHIFEIDPQAQVTWRNNCHPLNVTHGAVFPLNRSVVGLYTCFVSFAFRGQKYTAAQTTEIYSHKKDYVVTKPEIIYPKEETRTAILGERDKLTCKALVGLNDGEETVLYWRNGSSFMDFETKREREGEREYLLSVVLIPKITEDYLYKDFICVVQHPAGSDSGKITLIPATQNERYYWIGVSLVALLLLLCAVVFLFRVDLVLAYRTVCSPAVVSSDGNSYDAYVSYLQGDQHGSSSATTFALDFLPATLEDLHGYRLFISGRDELPGEAVHDVIADRMSRSRRLIIVLTSQSCASPQTDATNQIWADYERRVGLYDALVKQGLKVILVQVEDGVEEALLPESLQYIRRTKGVLKWRQHASSRANRSFWKHMRYRMPPATRQKSQELTVL
ncbi:interleukin-1 receptor type 1 isoform X2 [Puntigrus tetrazona]|nr:interleukin-1 receptor type 1 isoform X2 [Puntigrus tetrazona]